MTPELPEEIRQQLEILVADVGLASLREAAEHLAVAYAQGRAPTALGWPAALAYAAMRLPGTLSALANALDRTVSALAPHEPISLLDLCAGPGAGLLACSLAGIRLKEAVCVEREPAMIKLGHHLTQALGTDGATVRWVCCDALGFLENNARSYDLIVVGYALGELSDLQRQKLVELAWPHVGGGFVLVEPGTPAGTGRLLQIRSWLLSVRAHLIAPCPHDAHCPLSGFSYPNAPQRHDGPGAWCHFSQRIARSRLSRLIDGGQAAYEDEKFAYLVATPVALTYEPAARLVGHPRLTQAGMVLAACCHDGKFRRLLVPKRERSAYRLARKLRWGDPVPEEILRNAQALSE